MSVDDQAALRFQLGREPRGRWRVVARCTHGAPVVVATSPVLEGGEPFPTLFWLTCPTLSAIVSAMESEGATDAWSERLAGDPVLAGRMRAADARYRQMRRAEADGADPCHDVGIAGQRDPLKTKCLHAHVAAYLAGVADPIGEAVVANAMWECDDARCTRGAED